MTAFDSAVDALFADPNIARDAIYKPSGGDPTTVRVIAKRPDEILRFGDTRIHSATAVFDVQASKVPVPAEGDTLEIGNETFVIQSAPAKDREGLIWTLDSRPA